MTRLRKVAARLGCRRELDVVVPHQVEAGTSQGVGAASSHGPTLHEAGGSSSHRVGGSSSHGAGAAGTEDEDDYYDEMGMSQLDDAPQGTQEGERPHRTIRPVDRYTPGTYALGRGKQRTYHRRER